MNKRIERGGRDIIKKSEEERGRELWIDMGIRREGEVERERGWKRLRERERGESEEIERERKVLIEREGERERVKGKTSIIHHQS